MTQTIELAMATGSPMGRRIRHLLELHRTPSTESRKKLQTKILDSNSSKRQQYLKWNPNLTINPFLIDSLQDKIQEYDRTAVNRLRLISHNLKVERGRWTRIPPEERLCKCGEDIQDEPHVLISCPLSAHLRTNYNIDAIDINGLYNCVKEDRLKVAEYCRRTLAFYGHI